MQRRHSSWLSCEFVPMISISALLNFEWVPTSLTGALCLPDVKNPPPLTPPLGGGRHAGSDLFFNRSGPVFELTIAHGGPLQAGLLALP